MQTTIVFEQVKTVLELYRDVFEVVTNICEVYVQT